MKKNIHAVKKKKQIILVYIICKNNISFIFYLKKTYVINLNQINSLFR